MLRYTPPMFSSSLLLLACTPPIQAPDDLDGLSSYFFTAFPEEDPAALEAGVVSLLDFAATADLSANDWKDRSWTLTAFGREAVEGLVDHDHDPADGFGVGVMLASAHPVADHIQYVPMVDQRPLEPSSPDHYERSFPEGEDAQCFVDGDCSDLFAINSVERKNVLYTVWYELQKQWRWVDTPDGVASVARSWNTDEAHDGDNVHLYQGYSIDLHIPWGSGTLRYQASWQSSDVYGVSDEIIGATLGDGIDDALSTQEDWIGEQAAR